MQTILFDFFFVIGKLLSFTIEVRVDKIETNVSTSLSAEKLTFQK